MKHADGIDLARFWIGFLALAFTPSVTLLLLVAVCRRWKR
jgi:hypothetical protein